MSEEQKSESGFDGLLEKGKEILGNVVEEGEKAAKFVAEEGGKAAKFVAEEGKELFEKAKDFFDGDNDKKEEEKPEAKNEDGK